MSVALRLARPDDLDRVLRLVTACHAETGPDLTNEALSDAVSPLLDGIPHGCLYLIGPARSPLGFVILSFGWSVEFGGMNAILDQIYVRPAVRGRGIATEVLLELPKALAAGGVKALHLAADRDTEGAQRLCQRTGFSPRDRNVLMTRPL
ncbi:MAG: GNAT family N-acetyltransferase [Pseudomonadota bacterium]